jgi:hypothetical protein
MKKLNHGNVIYFVPLTKESQGAKSNIGPTDIPKTS